MTSAVPVNEQQLITISGNPNGGTYLLGFNGVMTTPLKYNANAGDMQAALCALPTVGVGNLTVVKRSTGPEYDVYFMGALGFQDLPLLDVDYSLLNRGSVTVTVVTHGSAGEGPGELPPGEQPAADPLLYELEPPDDEDVIVAWMTPVRGESANVYRIGDPLPFTLIRKVAGHESYDEGHVDVVMQVETLCDREAGWIAARDECRTTHRRMLQLAHLLEPFTLFDGTGVGVDYLEITESPRWHPSENNQILRKIGLYAIGLTYDPAPVPGS